MPPSPRPPSDPTPTDADALPPSNTYLALAVFGVLLLLVAGDLARRGPEPAGPRQHYAAFVAASRERHRQRERARPRARGELPPEWMPHTPILYGATSKTQTRYPHTYHTHPTHAYAPYNQAYDAYNPPFTAPAFAATLYTPRPPMVPTITITVAPYAPATAPTPPQDKRLLTVPMQFTVGADDAERRSARAHAEFGEYVRVARAAWAVLERRMAYKGVKVKAVKGVKSVKNVRAFKAVKAGQ